MAGFLSNLFVTLGLGEKHAIGFPKPNWQPEHMTPSWECTHDDARSRVWTEQQAATPRTALSGPSNQWVAACYHACSAFMADFLSPAAGSARFPIPYMLVRAGRDRFVHDESQEQFLEKQDHCRKVVSFPTAYHEVFVEADVVRSPAVDLTATFIKHHSDKAHHDPADPIYAPVTVDHDFGDAPKAQPAPTGGKVVTAAVVIGGVAVLAAVILKRRK